MGLFNFWKKRSTPTALYRAEGNKDSNRFSVFSGSKWESKKVSKEQMLEQYKSWVYIAARLNGESVAQQNIKLYAVTK